MHPGRETQTLSVLSRQVRAGQRSLLLGPRLISAAMVATFQCSAKSNDESVRTTPARSSLLHRFESRLALHVSSQALSPKCIVGTCNTHHAPSDELTAIRASTPPFLPTSRDFLLQGRHCSALLPLQPPVEPAFYAPHPCAAYSCCATPGPDRRKAIRNKS